MAVASVYCWQQHEKNFRLCKHNLLLMHILIVHNSFLPALKYGGIERAIWWLGKRLVAEGHKVSYLVSKGSYCPFADVHVYDTTVPFNTLIPPGVDVVHLSTGTNEMPLKPYIAMVQTNMDHQLPLNLNTVFVSANHAARYGSSVFVHNGLDPEDYGTPDFAGKKKYIHFLGDAAWRVKNVTGAIKVAAMAKIPLRVIGGVRFNFNQGIRLSFNPKTRFEGMKGGAEKNELLKNSAAMLFPVRWHEPFGIAIIESLYFGCPVFGTPYGSLPEIVIPGVGFLSNKSKELAAALQHIGDYDRRHCHNYVMENFTATKMAAGYMQLYQKVLEGKTLNAVAPQLVTLPKEKFLYFN